MLYFFRDYSVSTNSLTYIFFESGKMNGIACAEPKDQCIEETYNSENKLVQNECCR